LAGLQDPAAFPRAGDRVEVRQTHISLVFLTGDRVYKVKKTVALWGFLDYGTLEKRRFYCDEEVRLNRRLAPGVYLGVAPVVRRGARLAVGEVEADAMPRRATSQRLASPKADDGEVVDWCVVMRRLADEDTLAHRVRTGQAAVVEVEDVGRTIARSHATADRGPAVRGVARPIAFARILRQNFVATHDAVPRAFPEALHAWLARRVGALLRSQRATLARRWRAGVPVEGHGDLRAEHVVRADGPHVPDADRGPDAASPPWAIIDCVEFAPTLRCIDPLSDAAFLAMDLASLGRRDLAEAYLAAYLAERPDADAAALLPLFLAYRAHVRAKVDAHRATEDEVPAADRAAAAAGARRHLALAWSYARTGEDAPPPPLVLVAGTSGTGKSMLAHAMAPVLGADLVSSDVERKRLAGLPVTARLSGDALAALYSRAMSVRTYAALAAAADRSLAAGRPVILDATYLLRAARAAAVDAAHRRGCPTAIVTVAVPEEIAFERIARRSAAGADASDATWDVHVAQAAAAEPVGRDEADVVLRHDGRRPAEDALMPLLDGLCARDGGARRRGS
jgi:aminoglycoside phosphotransferase family enzyme/predicted kinase